MRKRGKTLSLLLAFSLALGSFCPMPTSLTPLKMVQAAELEDPTGPTSGNCGKQGDNIKWSLEADPDGTLYPEDGGEQPTCYKLTLTGTGEMDESLFLNADAKRPNTSPWYNYREVITSVSISEGITSICGYGLADLCSLKSITLPDSISSVGDFAFVWDSLLETVICGKGLKTIGEGAFALLPCLTEVSLNEGLTEIGQSAFHGCPIEQISLPESLSAIGMWAFFETKLSHVKIPKNVEQIHANPFTDAPLFEIQVEEGNPHFFVENKILYEKRENGTPARAIAYASSSPDTTVVIHPETEIIDAYAFNAAQNLASVTLPSALTTINGGAFQGCGLKELHIPENVKTISSNAFSGCQNLQNIDIPDNVDTLGTFAFSNCSSLVSATIGKGVQEFSEPFEDCPNLAELNVSPQNPYLESLENVVYNKDHTKLLYYASAKPDTAYYVLEQVKIIESRAIEYTNLEKLYLPQTLNAIGTGGISQNSKLNSIYFAGNAPAQIDNIYANAANLILYYIKSTEGWDDPYWGNKYTLAEWNPENTTQYSGSFGSVNWAYSGSDGSLSFTGSGPLPDFTEGSPAPWSAYMGSIQTVDAGEVTEFGSSAFSHASSLIRLKTGTGLSRIGDRAFEGCTKLKFLDISSANTIGQAAFKDDSSIPLLRLDNVSAIGEGAFQGCSAISSVTLGSRLAALEHDVFAGCSMLSSFLVPETVSSIGDRAFQGCTKLRSINIPASAASIGAQAFSGDAALERAYFYGGIPANWDSSSFEGCSGSLKLCYRSAQAGWDKLGGYWNSIPLLGQERFYTEGQDHYSFANSADSFGYPSGYRFPRRRYVETLGSISLGTYYYATDPGWSGSCYGMAGSTLEFYENPDFSVSSYGAPAQTLYEINAPRDKDAPLTKLIESYQISQFHPSISGWQGILKKNWNDYQGLIQKIEEFERSGGLRVDSAAEPVVLVLYSLFSAHAVIPVSVTQAENGDFLVKAYEPDQPSGLATLVIAKDFSAISHAAGLYTGISYIPYRSLASSISGTGTKGIADSSLYLSIDKEHGMAADDTGNGIENIEGAYEQKPIGTGNGSTFSGIRSFVLPKGNYRLAADTPEGEPGTGNADSVTFYMGTTEYFAEVTSTDETAALQIAENNGQGNPLSLELQSSSTTEETAAFTLVNSQGMERAIEIGCSNAAISIEGNNAIAIQAPGQETITIDGQKVALKDGKANIAFQDATVDPDGNAPGNNGTESPGNSLQPGSNNPDSSKKPDSNNPDSSKKPAADGSDSNRPSATKPGAGSSGQNVRTVTKVKVNVKKLTLGVGETYALKASALPANAANKKLRYSASNKKITVNSKGKVTAKKTGSAKITVKSSNGKKATVQVTIKKKPTKIRLNAKTKTIRAGWNFQIKAKFPKGTASNKLTYTSSRRAVASVSSTGKVTARKKGTAIITVKTYNGKKAKMKIIVKKKK